MADYSSYSSVLRYADDTLIIADIFSLATYAAETWTLKQSDKKRINSKWGFTDESCE